MKVLSPVPVAELRLLVFDLDGTLIDSRADLAQSVNAMLHHVGRAPLPQDVIAAHIGDGAAMLVRRSLSEGGHHDDDLFVHSALQFFLDYYRVHKLDHTYIYPGVIKSLERLRGCGRFKMACLTNKPVIASRDICAALGLAEFFFEIYGGNSFATKKPDAEGLRLLMHEAGVTAQQTLMIGDSHVDVQTARNCGAWALGCTFGLAPHSLELVPPDILVDAASEWPRALDL